MITDKELQAIKLSPTKKDYYQIWNELMDTAKKISDRWDPTATNESDPGIILLKVLTAVADKLNYNIDKNILEAFMPSAAQEESMRKLCEMVGYNMKYYNSAETKVTVTYIGEAELDTPLNFPAYNTIFTNLEKDLYYIAKTGFTITNDQKQSIQIPCIEGAIQHCESSTNNLITINLLDDNNRYYLPEPQVAENGIFVYSTNDGSITNKWLAVNNLNTQSLNYPCYKFGFDSKLGKPYIQFPEDIASIIGEGLDISYVRTKGANGNTARNTLIAFDSIPDNITITDSSSGSESKVKLTAEDFLITNENAATSGRNRETIRQAYNNYKKTVGTFDTLVTCRDYMNKIYQMLNDVSGIPLVSNIIVSDIRDDINKSITLCSFNDYGICYTDTPLTDETTNTNLINNFDLILYPFKTVYGLNTKSEYDNSFVYDNSNANQIESDLNSCKLISHVIKYPTYTASTKDIVCIKNYLKLNAKITTTNKVSVIEEKIILNAIKAAIYNQFNMRNLDFGEEIPFDEILECIEDSDVRIKNVSLDEPILYTKFELADGQDYDIASKDGKTSYINLAIRNILAGRVSLFNYNTEFEPSYTESRAKKEGEDGKEDYEEPVIYPGTGKQIQTLKSECTITLNKDAETILENNEVVQFRAPNFKTTVTYPAYVNYYLHLADADAETNTQIESNSEYRLKTGEALYINYTPAASSTDTTTVSTTAKSKTLTYPAGTIIRPNFTLLDSNKKYNDGEHHYSKVLKEYEKPTTPEGAKIEKMFTLDTSEQIEIREPVEIELGKQDATVVCYIYYDLTNTNKISDVLVAYSGQGTTTYKYTLQENEYFYYTDQNKINMAYYGSGTEIIVTGTDATILDKDNNSDLVSAEDILTKGLNIVPWKKITLSATANIILKEYQYITLTEKDSIENITADSITLNNTWNALTLNYKFSTQLDFESLPTINIEGVNWEVRSRLNFNVGPALTQTLTSKDKISIIYTDTTSSKITDTSFKTNYIIKSALDTINIGSVLTTTNDFKLKTFIYAPLQVTGASKEIPLNNYDTNLTKLPLTADYGFATDKCLPLYVNLPTNTFGLIMFYYNGVDAGNANAYIQSDNALKIFNNNSWWSDREVGTDTNKKYYFRPGINIVQVSAATTLNIYAATSLSSTLIFSGLDIINTTTGNKNGIDYEKLGLSATDCTTLLANIAAIDTQHNFYYNAPIEKNYELEINTASNETLATPKIWYDYNNINNKFVISEIDSTYLDTGITIARSSKL